MSMSLRSILQSVVPSCLLVFCTGLSAQSAGFADPVLGRWDLTVNGTDADYPSWLEIRLRRENQLMGRFVGRFGSVRHVTELGYENGQLRVAIPVQYEPGTADLVFEGRMVDGELRGTTVDAEGNTLTWRGVPAPLLQPLGDARPGPTIQLFNGRDLSGWSMRFDTRPGCWQVREGVLESTPPCVDLITDQEFNDFRLSVEFSYPESSNSGLYLRGRHEVQLQDTAGMALDALRMGAVYGFLTPYVDAALPPDQWQTMDITLRGRRISVVLNGQTVIDNQVIPGITGGALDSNEASPGPIMVQGDHGPIRFRRIELVQLR